MMRFTIIVIAFLLIIQSLEEEHILVYAHEGGEAGHKSLDYQGDQDSSTLHPKELFDAPRKVRFGRTTRAEKEQVTAMNNDSWSFKISGEHKQTNILADHDTTKNTFCKKMMIIVNDLTSLPTLEPSTSTNDMEKLARLLRDDYPIYSKPRRKPPVNNRAPDKF
ncbi:root meristem growth factor-like protein [Arabidopsis thaliana]|uniref:Protein GOLVEN 3 n=1 Tax=Arabidopsis thaliana TaxID=3702 RepID=GLV3_ARATH|nr:root meristem growth factor-like protein [Arabidopsis thaliana]Q9LI64.2 RecName: Full=Protein GOLVEN 3; AltName: Full=Root meristem growth factor 4; Short=AtRGF4; Contains: RecName: Full=GLV3p; Flags: Precursor [Arabidopsis thaliana]AEE77634.1 root meristem growth factor-like protein [Arabidopsis thaliana]|eukprot:NP_566853.1 root meristem growth factor-like protein [Arabidopsis thaliana]